MKKKIIAVVLLLCVALLTLTACFGSEKKFTVAGMTITLNNQFTEKDVMGQTKSYQSLRVAVTVLKEEFTLTAGMEDMTLKQYTQAVIKANKLSATVNEGEKYDYFTYEKTANAQNYYYYATTFKASDAFWLIQFGCLTSDKDKYQPKFEKWADTVVFED